MKYQAIFIGEKIHFYHLFTKNNDEFEKIYLWAMKENIGYFDECGKKISEILYRNL